MIYCVEDDNSIRDLMIYTLTIAGFEAKGFADSASFWKEMQTGRPELILLDIMLPGEDGISILKNCGPPLRQQPFRSSWPPPKEANMTGSSASILAPTIICASPSA